MQQKSGKLQRTRVEAPDVCSGAVFVKVSRKETLFLERAGKSSGEGHEVRLFVQLRGSLSQISHLSGRKHLREDVPCNTFYPS